MSGIRKSASARNLAIILVCGAALAACTTPHPRYAVRGGADGVGPTPGSNPNGAGGRYKVGEPYQVAGVWYVPKDEPNYDVTGTASWYGENFHLRPTANGEIFDVNLPSAAHPTLPLPSIVEVTNLDNGRKINVRINDRGPFEGGRVIDLSREGARQLGFDQRGSANVRVRYVGPGELGPPDARLRAASYNGAPPPGATLPSSPIAYAGLPSAAPSPSAVSSAPLTPIASGPMPLTPISAPAPVASGGAKHYRVQAGAFADHGNARRVADQLAGAGTASIESVQRADGVTLYRVMLAGGTDESQAWAVREQVAAHGFAEARVIRPF